MKGFLTSASFVVLASVCDAFSAVSSQAAVSSAPPTWDALAKTVDDEASVSGIDRKPLVTLYRDTNGWCPFCERVWVLLRAKGIPYEEQLVSLQKKPDWYKALIPTALVPAVLIHGPEETNDRRIVWESADIMQALDEEFPDTPKMVFDENPEYQAAVQMNDDLTQAGFRFIYAGRNDTLTDDDKLERRSEFLSELDRLDAALCEQQEHSGSFSLGKDFTAADAIMIPTLERWRYQLPITSDVDILESRPGLSNWFKAVDAYEPYSNRVAGDAYSWTATNSMFLRYFAGGEDNPDTARLIRRADDAAKSVDFVDAASEVEADYRREFAVEAAAKLASNHEAVVKDCTSDDPKSQQHIGRAPNPEAADMILRYVTNLLLCSDNAISQAKNEMPSFNMEEDAANDAAAACRIVASRLCVPRDMSKPAASVLRAVLTIVAEKLESSSAGE